MVHPRPLFSLFSSFQAIITIFTANICEKMSIQYTWCWDSNPQPSGHESPPFTTRPGLPPIDYYLVHGCISPIFFLTIEKAQTQIKFPLQSLEDIDLVRLACLPRKLSLSLLQAGLKSVEFNIFPCCVHTRIESKIELPKGLINHCDINQLYNAVLCSNL